MKQFIISEQEKIRILEMHQNATSRQYLMEDDKGHTGQVIDIMIPWMKNQTGAVIPAREAFTKPEYIATFYYYVGGLESKAIKDNGNKLVSQITKIVDNITGTEIPTYGAQTYDPATNTIRGKVVPPSDPKNKYSWDATKTSNYSVTFQDGGVINPIAVKYKQGNQYTPKQK
jgi:hypothetical protein